MKYPAKFAAGMLMVGIAAVMAFVSSDGAMAAGRCYSDWSEASPVVRREGLVPVKDLRAQVQSRMAARVVKVTLCKSARGYEYRLVVFEKGGKARNLTLDARRPFN